ncbi:MAG: hypothetical protein QOI43_2367 [Gaiellales bacterium]|nr:hypothetical protein [Gaiellales bacterium]
MTFALAARCEWTGAFGACAATADLAVGARVGHVEAGVGAILTQHRTDPRLGPRGLDLLRSGCDATQAIAALVASTPLARWRQLAAVDAAGASAAFSGSEVVTTSAEEHGPGCVAIGNLLASPDVASAMVAAFAADTAAPLAERLVRALEGGAAAGGETGATRSAVVLVALDPGMRLVDLRVDDDPAPIESLRRLWNAYRPWADDLRLRALDPDRASGVPEAAPADRVEGLDR